MGKVTNTPLKLDEAVTLLHALGGAIALGSMWIPILSAKGSALHRKAGRIYVWTMAWVSISAVGASALRLVAQPEQPQGPLFLSLVAIQSAAAVWWGVSVLRQKNRTARGRSLPDWIAAGSLLVSGMFALVYWLQGATLLFAVFGALHVVLGLRIARVIGRSPQSRFWWWYEHLFGMGIACIGTLTAFFVVNYAHAPVTLQSMVPQLVVWIAPGFLGGLGIAIATNHYRHKFGE